MRVAVRLKPVSHRTLVVMALVTALVAGLVAVAVLPTARADSLPAELTEMDAAALAETTLAIEMQQAAIAEAALQAAAAPHLAAQKAYATQKAAAVKIQQTRMRIVEVAKNQIGDRYSAGSAGPSAFDCSGLTRYVYKTVTGKELPHQSHAQYSRVKRIARKDAKPGDLVFFFGGGAHHVGIYIGNGRMVDAAGYGKGVRISPISGSWWSRTYSGMGRLLPA
jgi:cell wall-associated NlpC family hydrolase